MEFVRDLKKGDGISVKDARIVEAVKQVQQALQLRLVDGMFGSGTEGAVKRAQAQHGLPQTGVVDRDLWDRLFPAPRTTSHGLQGFRGDLAWIHAREGHAGKPYLPMNRAGEVIGVSGITLDPGVDLGHVDLKIFSDTYTPILGEGLVEYLKGFAGLTKGEAKKAWEANKTKLRSIKISREQADQAFSLVTSTNYQQSTSRRHFLPAGT